MGRKITAIQPQERNKERVNIYLDGEFAFGLTRIVAGWLQVGQELDDEKIAALLAQDERERAYIKALRLLQHAERSEAEMQRRLKTKGVSDEVIEEVIQRLRRAGLVDDQRLAQSWVENRAEFRPRSRRALQYELESKGIPKEVVDEALEDVDDDRLAYQAAVKQSRKYRGLSWPEYRQKMLAFLARRGFNYETSASAARQTWLEVQNEVENKRQNEVDV